MKLPLLAVVSGLLALVVAVPAPSSHAVHEKRDVDGSKWTRSNIKLRRDTVMPMSIGLKQRNLDNGYEYLMEVSDPKSPNFGKHWSKEKITETFKASDETIAAVRAWLTNSGIGEDRVTLSKGLNWLKFDVTIDEAEALMHTEYKIFDHADTGKPHLACEDYSVPLELRDHIDFITPTVQFDAIIEARPRKREEVDPDGHGIAGVRPLHGGQEGPSVAASTLAITVSNNSTANCSTYTTPDCLRALYNFPHGSLQKSSYGIVEYTTQAYLQGDLNLFYANLAPEIPAGTGPTVDLIDGAVVQTSTQDFKHNGESDLDLEYAIALVYPQTVTLYQVGDLVEGASFNNFLDAIDGSYCTSGGGDDKNIDATYPDPASGGYNGPEDCGTFAATAVISTSYGYNEADLPASYEQRQCNEYMKLGLAGVTVIFSSGDNGVAGNGNVCCTNRSCAGASYGTGKNAITFNPSFPSTCPYVTSVGATQIKPGASVTAPEVACQTVITSGGGFSNVFAQPSYQAAAVANYYKHYNPHYRSQAYYNDSKVVRGYPDVSANGANYVVAFDGALGLVYGTSASAPTFGSIITLINEQRALAGKGSVGFINPTIYAHADAFNDIQSGSNPGCGTNGFTAVPGWDPVTGLGTPNYQKLLSVYMGLP